MESLNSTLGWMEGIGAGEIKNIGVTADLLDEYIGKRLVEFLSTAQHTGAASVVISATSEPNCKPFQNVYFVGDVATAMEKFVEVRNELAPDGRLLVDETKSIFTVTKDCVLITLHIYFYPFELQQDSKQAATIAQIPQTLQQGFSPDHSVRDISGELDTNATQYKNVTQYKKGGENVEAAVYFNHTLYYFGSAEMCEKIFDELLSDSDSTISRLDTGRKSHEVITPSGNSYKIIYKEDTR
jgi:hypothetical protein